MVDLEKPWKPEECRKKMNQWKHGTTQQRENALGLVMVFQVIGCLRDAYNFYLANHKAYKRKTN